MLSGEGNAGERWKTTIGLISIKKKLCTCSTLFCTFHCRSFVRLYTTWNFQKLLRAFLHGGGGPQIGEVTCGGSPHLSCKRDQVKMRDYMDKRVTPPKRVTSPTWGPPPPCKQALSYTFYGGNVVRVPDHCFSLPLIFTLHWWPLAFLILLPPLQDYHVILPTKKCHLCFLSLALDLCRPFSGWVSLACRLLYLFLCLFLALYSKFVDMTINLSSIL